MGEEFDRETDEADEFDEVEDLDDLNDVDEMDEMEDMEPDESMEPEPLGEGGPNTREAFEETDKDDGLLPDEG